MIDAFRGNSKNTKNIISLQVLLGLGSIGYFIYSEQYFYIAYAFLMFYAFINLLHNVALHRYFSHNSFKTNKFWHIVMSVSAPLACAGSPYAYSMAHRAHHIFSDTEKDPHGKIIGFWKIAMFDWNFKKIPISTAKSLNEKWILFSHKYYALIILLFYLSLCLIDFKLGLVYNLCVLLLWIGYISINIVNHGVERFSYRNFETNDKSFNNLIVGYIVGEWHNNHHKNPQQWNQRIKWWEFDVAAQIVKIIKI
jgi:stearoyl-CoA desaturase (delta-9 desaturase)